MIREGVRIPNPDSSLIPSGRFARPARFTQVPNTSRRGQST